MQPRVKSKLWGNDSLTTHVHEQNKKSGDQNTQLKGKETGASVLAQLDDNEKSEPRSLDSRGAEKSSNLAFDEVISDMDYLKSRVKKEWSDSEKSDDEDNSDNSGKDGGKTKLLKMRREHQDIQKVDLKVQRNALEIEASEEEVEEGFSEDPEHEVIDTKKDVLETGRLFVRNLPYTATYASGSMLLLFVAYSVTRVSFAQKTILFKVLVLLLVVYITVPACRNFYSFRYF